MSNPENLRSQIPEPTRVQDSIEGLMQTNPARWQKFEALLDSMLDGKNPGNVITKQIEEHAYNAAWAIKPEVDVIADATERINNPLARAVYTERDGKRVMMGVTDISQQRIRRKAAQVDLERNLEKATELSVRAKLGKLAIRT